jgi:hypothetical protein
MKNSGIPSGGPQRSDGRSEPEHLGYDDKGNPVVRFVGTATNDGEIVTDVGSDDLWADGSLYISAVDGAGTLWQKRNDVWTSI